MKARLCALALASLLAYGCEDLLTETPRDFLAPENFYQTASDAQAAVLGIYGPLMVVDGFKQRLWGVVDIGSDMSQVGPLEPNPTFRAIGNMAADPGNSAITTPWAQLYTSIGRANLAIERIPTIQMDATARAALVGEAKFLRALNYFYLVRLHGDVPLITRAGDGTGLTPRAAKEEVYRQIIEDADEAVKTLPRTQDAKNAGRPTAGAALTLLADVYLTRQEWQKAADHASRVTELGVHSLYPNYLQAFLPSSENGPEHIFSLQADGAPNEFGSSFVAMYFPREVGPGQGGGNGQIQPTQWHYDSYLPGDYRREVSYETRWTNVVNGRVFIVYPHVFKYRPAIVTNVNAGDVNYVLYRYAEVLLIQAEAVNELGRPGEAVSYLNMVRARARRGTGNENRAQPADYNGPQTQALVREAIFQERRWEMAHEPKRWFDLVRRGEQYFLSEIRAHDPQASAVEATDMLWPIPQTEIDANPALKQNPGY